MTYVEWLRVRNVLRITAIVLGALFLLAVVLRLSIARSGGYEEMILRMSQDPNTKVTQTTLPDGTHRTIMDNSTDQTHIVVDDHGYAGKHIVITEPNHRHHKNDHVAVGSVHVDEQHSGSTVTTTIDTNGTTDFSIYMAIASFVALIVATILGAPFAREADGHLEVALTKPVSRTKFALGAIGADVVGLLAVMVMTVLFAIITQALFQVPRFGLSADAMPLFAWAIVLPLSWYALLNAATASLKRGYGAILGFAWPVCIFVAVMGVAQLGDSPLGAAVHSIFWTLSRIDPLTYAHFHSSRGSVQVSIQDLDYTAKLGILTALTIIYGALAVFQWRRVEA
jgi:ABC-type transport system involved in multi-copper enzyme maturation permease subunit